ncbi:hypothetical protein KO465_08505 [Candidatus Micrarchaeota archaeon]|nr:hypothetical protein [Candidatus Micrarchaeota archaeon]
MKKGIFVTRIGEHTIRIIAEAPENMNTLFSHQNFQHIVKDGDDETLRILKESIRSNTKINNSSIVNVIIDDDTKIRKFILFKHDNRVLRVLGEIIEDIDEKKPSVFLETGESLIPKFDKIGNVIGTYIVRNTGFEESIYKAVIQSETSSAVKGIITDFGEILD